MPTLKSQLGNYVVQNLVFYFFRSCMVSNEGRIAAHTFCRGFAMMNSLVGIDEGFFLYFFPLGISLSNSLIVTEREISNYISSHFTKMR